MILKKIGLSLTFFVSVMQGLVAQQHLDPEYIKVTNERAAKIVNELKLSDSDKEEVVTKIVGEQYRNLSKLHDSRDVKIDEVKKSDLPKEKLDASIEKVKAKSEKQIKKLHKAYIKSLSKHLTDAKIDEVKDGMTYGVLPKTYAAFLEMIPSLTDEEKTYIYSNLKEAREYAMDGGSSNEKHAWFGKYKGRINNYLSARGYDLTKERDEWYKRIEESKKAEQ